MPRTNPTSRGGFTLIELLVVVGIIGVLSAIVFVAGRSVLAGGKKTATQDVLRVLDTALEAYISSKDGLPDAWVYAYVDTLPDPLIPNPPPPPAILLADARVGGTTAPRGNPNLNMINSGGLFMLLADAVPNAKAGLANIPAKYVASRTILGNPPVPPPNPDPRFPPGPPRGIPTPVDAWGNAIRFVLPSSDGRLLADPNQPEGTGLQVASQQFPQRKHVNGVPVDCPFNAVRRNNVSGTGNADSDGGVCVGNRPYFYSCGEDGDPSTIEDNVYTTIPTISKD